MVPSRVVRRIGQEWTPEKHRSMVLTTMGELVVGVGLGYQTAVLFVMMVWELYTANQAT